MEKDSSGREWHLEDDEYNREGVGADAERFPPFVGGKKTFYFVAILPYHRRENGMPVWPFRAVRVVLMERNTTIGFSGDPNGGLSMRAGTHDIESAFSDDHVIEEAM